MGESPTQFNEEPDAGSTGLVVGIIVETAMKINWHDFLVHLGVQVGTAALTAAIAALAHYDYSSLGVVAPAVQGLAALAATAWNTYEAK